MTSSDHEIHSIAVKIEMMPSKIIFFIWLAAFVFVMINYAHQAIFSFLNRR